METLKALLRTLLGFAVNAAATYSATSALGYSPKVAAGITALSVIGHYVGMDQSQLDVLGSIVARKPIAK